jgi:hypothetical protein
MFVSLARPPLRIWVLPFLALALAGCAGVAPESYRSEKPVLDLARYFDGTVDGWGMVQDRSGKVLRRFTVVIQGRWTAESGTLEEDFVWSDGKRERRVWEIRRAGDGRYVGRAADVVGEAQGVAAGNALQWRYVLQLPADQGGYKVDLDDWMYLVDDKVMLNRSTISKFGIRFADITISFSRR